jgi:hypothetical protein
VSDLILLEHLVLLHLLDRNDLACRFVTADAHLAECATTNDLERLEVLG